MEEGEKRETNVRQRTLCNVEEGQRFLILDVIGLNTLWCERYHTETSRCPPSCIYPAVTTAVVTATLSWVCVGLQL